MAGNANSSLHPIRQYFKLLNVPTTIQLYSCTLQSSNPRKKKKKKKCFFWKHLKKWAWRPPSGRKIWRTFWSVNYKSLQQTNYKTNWGGIFMVNEKWELLNSKSEWNQLKIIRSTIHSGGAELVGGRMQPFPMAGGPVSQGRADTTPCLMVGRAGEDSSRGGRLGGEGGQEVKQD